MDIYPDFLYMALKRERLDFLNLRSGLKGKSSLKFSDVDLVPAGYLCFKETLGPKVWLSIFFGENLTSWRSLGLYF